MILKRPFLYSKRGDMTTAYFCVSLSIEKLLKAIVAKKMKDQNNVSDGENWAVRRRTNVVTTQNNVSDGENWAVRRRTNVVTTQKQRKYLFVCVVLLAKIWDEVK